MAAGAALALALPNRDAASEDDLKTLSDQVSSLQQQLAGQEHSLQSRIDAAVKKVEQKTRPKASRAQDGSVAGTVQRNSADIERIKAYLRNPAGAFGAGRGKR